jgi:hypothetical protein
MDPVDCSEPATEPFADGGNLHQSHLSQPSTTLGDTDMDTLTSTSTIVIASVPEHLPEMNTVGQYSPNKPTTIGHIAPDDY